MIGEREAGTKLLNHGTKLDLSIRPVLTGV